MSIVVGSYKHDKYEHDEHHHSYESKYSIDDLITEISMLNDKLKIQSSQELNDKLKSD